MYLGHWKFLICDQIIGHVADQNYVAISDSFMKLAFKTITGLLTRNALQFFSYVVMCNRLYECVHVCRELEMESVHSWPDAVKA